MAKKPPSHVTIRGVRYVPELPDVATRRRAEREDVAVVRGISKAMALGLARSGAPKPKSERDPGLHHYVMMLAGGLNHFEFEGSLVLPPKRVETAEGKGEMAVFLVGRQPVHGKTLSATPRKTIMYASAYGDLATDILTRYRWKDHLRVWGIVTSVIKFGRPLVSLVVQRVELVERHPDNAHLDDSSVAVLGLAMPSGGGAESSILDVALAAPSE